MVAGNELCWAVHTGGIWRASPQDKPRIFLRAFPPHVGNKQAKGHTHANLHHVSTIFGINTQDAVRAQRMTGGAQ